MTSSKASVRALDDNEEPMELLRYIEVIEKCFGRTAKMEMLSAAGGRCVSQ